MVLTDELYERFRDLLASRSGLAYPPHRRADLSHGLQMALRASGMDSLAALYVAALDGGPVWQLLLAQLTIGETYFFRNAAQFDALRLSILPDLIARRAATRSLRIWSAGCATGEEPYSLAMLLEDVLPDRASWHVSILATDINQQFLARAREGLYGGWSFRETPEAWRERCFTPEEGRWRLLPQLRRAVQFSYLNLAEPSYPAVTNGTTALDLIVCRNVTIYFAESTTRQIVQRFYDALVPGGWLVVGHAEPQASVYHQFEVQNFPETVVYRKPLDAPLFATESARGSLTPLPARAAPDTSLAHSRAGGAAGPPATPPSPPRSAPPSIPTAEPTALSWATITAQLAQGDKPGAERRALALLERNPDHAGALALLGRLMADSGNWELARGYCQRALARDPLAIEVHYTLGQVHEHQGQLSEALASYRRTVYLDRSFVPGMLGMAATWRRMGLAAEAQRSYQAALRRLRELSPSAPVPGMDATTAGELIAFVIQQLATLDQ